MEFPALSEHLIAIFKVNCDHLVLFQSLSQFLLCHITISSNYVNFILDPSHGSRSAVEVQFSFILILQTSHIEIYAFVKIDVMHSEYICCSVNVFTFVC